MTEASRASFEAEYPVPDGCHYLVVANRYSFVSPDVYYHIRDLQDQNTAWKAWQAARASVVVALPPTDNSVRIEIAGEDVIILTERESAIFNLGVETCKAAIVAAGASVK